MLDVGCGNHSPSVTKAYFPTCRYFGVDKVWYNNDERDRSAMEAYYEIDVDEPSSMESLRDDFFDCIILNHIIEHTRNGVDVLKLLSRKLKHGGTLYVETPSERSLTLPRMKGTLNFYDDPTHVRVYTLDEMNKVLSDSGIRIERSGTRRFLRKIVLMPVYAIASFFTFGHLRAVVFWDLLGFAHYTVGVRQ